MVCSKAQSEWSMVETFIITQKRIWRLTGVLHIDGCRQDELSHGTHRPAGVWASIKSRRLLYRFGALTVLAQNGPPCLDRNQTKVLKDHQIGLEDRAYPCASNGS